MSTIDVHMRRWLDLPWVRDAWGPSLTDLLPAVERCLVRPMLDNGVDPGRQRYAFTAHRDSVSRFLKAETLSAVTGEKHWWFVRPTSQSDDDAWGNLTFDEFAGQTGRHFARQDRILRAMGEPGRFRRVDPAWSYDVHPVLRAHLRGHGIDAQSFVGEMPRAGGFRSVTRPSTRPSWKDGLIIHRFDEALGYLDGRVRGGAVELGKIELSSNVHFAGDGRIVLRDMVMPETMKAALPGLHVLKVVDHHAFDVPDLIVTGVRTRRGNVELSTNLSHVPLAPGRPKGFRDDPVAIAYAESRDRGNVVVGHMHDDVVRGTSDPTKMSWQAMAA